MPRLGAQLLLNDRRHERVSVDLSMGMAQGDADSLASVLEDVDITHPGQPREIKGAIAPHLDEILDVLDGLLAQGRIVVRRVADDLAATLLAAVGGIAILEHGDVVVRLWDLGLHVTWAGRAKRTVIGGRMVRSVLTPGRDSHPFLEQRMPSQLAHARS